ncbi:MAG: PAS domain-containing hybrid sensor histidine kinase/response regulator [Candidatus Methylomirabilia bacterium]
MEALAKPNVSGGPALCGEAGRFRDLLDRLPQTVFEADPEGRITYANKSGLAAFGYSLEEVRRGLTLTELVLPEQRDRARANLGRRLAGGPEEFSEYVMVRKDGSTFPALVHAAPVLSDGRPVGIQGSVVNISERKRAEEALQQSEGKYKALVEATATGFVILDHLGRVIDANAEYVRMTGRRFLAEIVGRSVEEWTAAYDRERNAEEVCACFREGFVRNLQLDYVQPTGAVVPVEINATVVEVDGSPQIITIIRDITDRKNLEQELIQAEKLRSVGVLAGGIAHDFNNILTAVLGNISLLRETLAPDAAAVELLLQAEQASFRARDLTQQLLTFSRSGAPVRRDFSPGALVRESATMALRGRGSACEFRIEDGLWSIEADEGQIGQVIRNLVINASQAMAGGGTVVIGCRNRAVRDHRLLSNGSYVAVSVADRGAGIPQEHRPRIFDPYFTTKQEGSGLGLAISYSIVVNHGGVISVASQPGQGTVFTVYLPATGKASAANLAVGGEPFQGRGRVLVMDDEPMVREIAGRIIRSLGYEVAGARDGREAIAAWQQAREGGKPFDVVIMDLTIPGGMGGREAVRELLALDPGAKVIVSSGYHQDPIMARYREFGFQDLLAKPYGVAEVGRALVRLVRPS